MKKTLLAACLLSLIVSCKKEETKELAGKAPLAYVEVPKESHKELYGLWTGTLTPVYEEMPEEEYEDQNESDTEYNDGPKKITIKINRITQDSVFGQSIVGGNQRPFRGVLSDRGQKLSFILDEPGKAKDDGRFELSLANDTLQGSWAIYKPNKETSPKKTLKLVQKQFVYNPNFMLNKEFDQVVDWDKPMKQESSYTDEDGKEEIYIEDIYRVASDAIFTMNASTEAFTEESLKNLRKLDLEILRNSIFARHGYSFKKSSLRYFFESSDWYVPVSNNVDNDLTALEKQNITLLKRLEQYATDHYDTFGR